MVSGKMERDAAERLHRLHRIEADRDRRAERGDRRSRQEPSGRIMPPIIPLAGEQIPEGVLAKRLRQRPAGRAAENLIRASELDWTIFRPPALSAKPARGTYRTAIDRNLPHGFSVTRGDLAACMVARLDDPATVRRHVGVAK